VARPLAGTVAMLAPDGTLLREISLRGKEPTNLTFGGADGRLFSLRSVTGASSKLFGSIDQDGNSLLIHTKSDGGAAAGQQHPNQMRMQRK
jgi:sugar lactone lactonase YvrE